MKRTFDEYLREAIDSGWWQGGIKPDPDNPPRVLFEVGGNMLRRQRGGRTHLLKTLWPKLKLIVSVDWRMSTTGQFSDYVLPASQHYEKPNFHLASPALLQMNYSDGAAGPGRPAQKAGPLAGGTLAPAGRRGQRRRVRAASSSSTPTPPAERT